MFISAKEHRGRLVPAFSERSEAAMVDYVVRCSQAKDGSLARRSTAFEAIELLEAAISQGWELREILRDKKVIDELSLRNDACRERPGTDIADETQSA